MKLYATTTSERASKGQGGNKYLHIKILGGDAHEQQEIGNVIVTPSKSNGKDGYGIVFSSPKRGLSEWIIKKTKGKCKHNWRKVESHQFPDLEVCENCAQTKGKRQKGEINAPSRPDWIGNEDY